MANRARIKVLRKGERTAVYHITPPSQELIEQKAIIHVIGNALSNPNTPSQLAKTTVINIHFIPAYLLEYNLHEDFSTTVGIVHSVHVDKGQILINGQDGGVIEPRLARILAPSSMTENLYPEASAEVSSGRFKIGYSSAKRIGIRHIQRRHTETVGYYGANNVHYTKKCVPHVSKILVRSLIQVYLPLLTALCTILTRRHRLSLCGNRSEVEILDSDAGICEICGKELGLERLLCNSCGRVVHAPSFMGHSYFCELCGKTICKECAYWTRKYLFFKKKLCESCAEKLKKEGKKIRKFT